MAGNNRPPYRTPCAGWTYAWNGQKYQNGKRTEKEVATYNQTNTSQTIRWPLEYLDGDLMSGCSSSPTGCEAGDPPRCGAFPYIYQTPMIYELTGDTGDFSVCKKIGHKNIQARKSWYGFVGFDGNHKTHYLRSRQVVGMTGRCLVGDEYGYQAPVCTWTDEDGLHQVPWNGTPPLSSDWDISGASASAAVESNINKDTGIITLIDLGATVYHASAYNWTNEDGDILADYVNASYSYTPPVDTPCEGSPTIAGTSQYAMPTALFLGNIMQSFSGVDNDIPIFRFYLPFAQGVLDTDPMSPMYGNYVIDADGDNGFADVLQFAKTEYIGTMDEIADMLNKTYLYRSGGGSDFILRPSWDDQSPTSSYCRAFDADYSLSGTSVSLVIKGFEAKSTTSTNKRIDYELTITITLSEPYTMQDVLDDCHTMTAQWNPADDVQYPWRGDEYLTIAPLLSQDEVRSYSDVSGYLYSIVKPLTDKPDWNSPDYSSPVDNGDGDSPFSAGWVANPAWAMITDQDPNSIKFDWASTYSEAVSNGYAGTETQWYNEQEPNMALYAAANSISYDRFTGAIKGAPSGKPGVFPDASNFDYEHITWNGIACPSGGSADFDNLTPYIERIGAKSGDGHDPTDAVVPIQSTQWTDNYYGCLFPPGSFIKTDGAYIHLQSSIFTLLPIPSMNYARPCGADRFSADEDKTACVDYDDGTNITVHSDASADIPTGTICVVKTGVGNDGVFTLTTSDGITYVRSGAKISDIPANTTFEPELTSDNFIATVRFPTAPGICGRVSVSSAVQDGASVHITVGDTLYLKSGDKVDFTNISGLGSNVNVDSVESSTSFTVTGTLSGAYTSGGYVSSHGAAAYYWYDDSSKGDYVSAQWFFDNAGSVDSYTVETRCLPFTSCDPGVVGHWLTPVTFANGLIDDFPAADDLIFNGTREGVVWQGGVWVGMPDLYFQIPHSVKGSDCDTSHQMKDDDGACNSDTKSIVYYPSAARVEARVELPTDAPALTGVSFPDYSIPPSIIGTNYTSGDYNGILPTGTAITEHGNYLAKYACACGETPGRFSEIYKSQGISCC